MARVIAFVGASMVLLLFAGLASGATAFPVSDSFPSSGAQQPWVKGGTLDCSVVAFSPSAPGGDGYVYNVNDGSGWQCVTLGDGTDTDYEVECYIYAKKDTANWGRWGIVARAQGQTYTTVRNCYYLFADSDDGHWRCGKYWGNGISWGQYFEGYYDPNTELEKWYKFKIACQGDQISFYVDDVLKGTATDNVSLPNPVGSTVFSAGYFGIINYLYNSSSIAYTYADNFVATGPTPAPTPTPSPTFPPGFNAVGATWTIYE